MASGSIQKAGPTQSAVLALAMFFHLMSAGELPFENSCQELLTPTLF